MKKILINDHFILFLIVLNALVLFFDSFDSISSLFPHLDKIDLVINLVFIMEMIFKIKDKGFSCYLKDNWNKMDLVINLVLILSFVLVVYENNSFMALTVLRLIRLGKFFRIFKFVPNIEHIVTGVNRALKSSVFIFVVFLLYLFIISILSCFFFKTVSPEHFGDPLLSLYSTFKIFTVEGWYELPELIADKYGETSAFFVKLYFIFLVISGGIFGMGIVNAVFVDEMVSDNNEEVLNQIQKLNEEIQKLADKLDKKD